MNPRPVAEFLTSFGKEPVAFIPETAPEPIVFGQHETLEDPVDLIEEARFRGVIEGFASGEAAIEVRLEEQRLLFEKQLEAEKSIWTCKEGAAIHDQIKAALEDVETSLTSSIKRILRPFINKAVIDKLVSELCKTVSELLRDKELCFIEIRVPENLLDELQEKLGIYQSIKFVQSDSREVTVFTNQSMLETQFSTWLDQISLLSE